MQRFKNILVVANADGVSDALIARAEWLAQSNDATLTLIDVIDTNPSEFSRLLSVLPGARAKEVAAQVLEARKAALQAVAAPLRAGGRSVEVVLGQGVGFIEVIRHAMRHDIDLVIKAADVAPMTQVMGGTDLHLLRKCPCPVWVLNSAAEPNARRIVAAVDPDPEDRVRNNLNNKVMELATSLARRDAAKLDVLNAWYLNEESTLRSSLVKAPEEEIAALLGKAERDSAWRLHRLTEKYSDFSDLMHVMHVKGVPANVISEHAEHAVIDTLVMGTLGRSGLAGLFIGNTADTVFNRVGCSVLAVKPEGFISPVTLDEESSP